MTAKTSDTTTAESTNPPQDFNLEALVADLNATAASIQAGKGESLPVLEDFSRVQEYMHAVYLHFIRATRDTMVVSYGGEWLLDNYYIVQQALQQIEKNMPPSYYRRLPKLDQGSLEGYPRIYILAHALSHFLQSRITTKDQSQFLRLFQASTTLTIGELWAWPTMLRIVIIENLIAALEQSTNIRFQPPEKFMSPGAHLTYRQELDSDFVIANCITTLRAINAQDWSLFFEDHSLVEAVLRRDPCSVYPHMDFETRDRYRRVIENLAGRSTHSEAEVAEIVQQRAQYAHQHDPQPPARAHVGYYLIGEGIHETRNAIAYQQPFHESLASFLKKHALFVYLAAIWLLAGLVVALALGFGQAAGASMAQMLLITLLTFIPAVSVASHLVNWLTTQMVAPSVLPKLEFKKGIPGDFRSVVVIPALLTDPDEVQSLVQQLEQHYLRNTDPNLYFAILADYADADQETLPEDRALMESAKALVQALNTRYGGPQEQPFFFFLRKRQWNPLEEKWMGYERKRGKLAEFNQLLLNPAAETSYTVKVGNLQSLRDIRYVITLDADTILPRDAAHELIGTFAHPLNQAQFETSTGRLSAGYTILQPRIEILPSAANRTAFSRIFAGERGLDLYTLSVSDVYQDLFNQGIYVGKGIYDVAAFERSLKVRTPENALLSHDLFEGLHGRVGLVTDVIFLEDYPTHYLAHIKRVHRWVRGDWQLLPWLQPRVPSVNGQTLPNVFSVLDRWKILDNLLRSLLHPALFAMIVLGWLWLPGSAFVWTAFALLVLLIPFLIGVFNQVKAVPLVGSLEISRQRSLVLSLLRWALSLAFLPYEALIRLDAIVVTMVRLRQRKHLLEWTTSASDLRKFEGGTADVIHRRMLGIVALAAFAAFAAFWLKPYSLLISVPLLAVWLSGPALAQRISEITEQEPPELSEDDLRKLRTLSRRTWLFFEEFVGPADHWLPPDHYQQWPVDKVGHYTSPTNIGLLMMSIVAAYDQGYIGLLDMVTRLHFTFETIQGLERYRGHLLNWYNTSTLQALTPRYVSTVDNGNLAACLLIVRQASDDIYHSQILRPRRWQGVLDTLDVIAEVLDSIVSQQAHPMANETEQHVENMRGYVLAAIDEPGAWIEQLEHLANHDWQLLSDSISALADHLTDADAQLIHDLRVYLGRLQHHLSSIRRDIDLLLPWLPAIAEAPDLDTSVAQIRQAWHELLEICAGPFQVAELPKQYEKIEHQLAHLGSLLSEQEEAALAWCETLQKKVSASSRTYGDLLDMSRNARHQIDAEFSAMDFSFLYDEQRHLFHIGYNVDNEQLDNSYYDMLASEARLASFLAIAKRDVSQQHWLHLSRPVTQVYQMQTLLSWSGTMFEYLMPPLFMRDYPNTLLRQSYDAVVEHQISFGRQHNIPWGVSESGYYAFDSIQNYQYRAFGLPDLGFKRGQEGELVVAPYASILALSLRPQAVIENIQHLITQSALTTYGFVEALDYTTSRLPLGRQYAVVKEYMSHHQGMIFIALTNHLLNNIMVERFHRSPLVKSVELLLMEQIPQESTFEERVQSDITSQMPASTISTHPWEVAVDTPAPEVHLLSNGRYSVMMTNAGSGYSQWKNRAITRWRADTTLDNWGQWLYLFDEHNHHLWSPTRQPAGSPDTIKTIFHPGRIEFQSRSHNITSRLEVMVAPDDDLEIRRLTLTNHSEIARHLTVCSYGEMVLAPQANDQRHPAFNKMFIESEVLPELEALLFQRRPRSAHDAPMYVLHMVIGPATAQSSMQHETDRKRFLGRNRGYRNPSAFSEKRPGLSGTTGATLDPIMAIARSLRIAPHSAVEMVYVTLAADTRQQALALAQRYRAREELDRAANQSRYRSEGELRHLGLNADDIARYQRLLSSLIYPNPAFRAPPDTLAANSKAQPGLWAYGISGDYPIVLVEINNEEQLELLHELVMAHRFWRDRGFAATLVILNQSDTGYMQELYNAIHRLLLRTNNANWLNRHDGIFIVRADQLNDADLVLLRTAARVWFDAAEGSLAHQVEARRIDQVTLPPLQPSLPPQEPQETITEREDTPGLLFDNGFGGFTDDGQEYVIRVDAAHKTPSPWINVIANAEGGFTVSEAGGGFTWAENSGEHRLSSWRNDPVTDMPAEAIYLRDEETALVWSPTPMPAGKGMSYTVRHGAGYSTFEHHSHDLTQTTTLFMAPDEPVKCVQLRLRNTAPRPRRITITYYMEWVLGPLREITQQYLIPEFDTASQTILAHNPYSIEFANHYAFVTADKSLHGMTADRTEFLGRNGDFALPAALQRIGLNSNVRAGIDPCAVLQLHVDLPIGGEDEICFIIGSAEGRAAALALSQQYRNKEAIKQAREKTIARWRGILDSIVVRTPDPAMNILLPWLLYQALSCRIWGRSALYQSSGAYGFRDQLQDVAALIHVRPDLTREHILRAAQHQFEAGDVLHWWHPPSGRGVRTHFADDLVWLPFIVSHYMNATGDTSLLESEVPFLIGEELRPDEEERYGFYETSSETYSIYEHCRRALNRAYSLGRHNLPLMKAGDWNDGMNRVGIKGEGESVWMGWFLYTALDRFLPLCQQMDDPTQAATYREWMQELQSALEDAGWDGNWYRRAYYDDGTPLGSAQNMECRIDSLPQSWAVLSGAGDTSRAEEAMAAVEEHLVRRDDQLIQLFTPPFNHTSRDPGYIKGYPPGIRENGGQYTHAALWAVWAFAELGKGSKAESLFRLLNPIYHSDTAEKASHYGVEPYVIAADVYSVPPHTGRGGWTWYTGSSGWMYRLGVEAILGLKREGNRLRIEPRTASEWTGFEVDYRYGESVYHIKVVNHAPANRIEVDGKPLSNDAVPLVDDGNSHEVIVHLNTGTVE